MFVLTATGTKTKDNNQIYSHIVNVTALEGKFNVGKKSGGHPHTNMAKAALNMMTLTGARDYARTGILMNSVDTVRIPFLIRFMINVIVRANIVILHSVSACTAILCNAVLGLGDGHGPGGRGRFLRHARDLHRASA